jgi:hypothetical protein
MRKIAVAVALGAMAVPATAVAAPSNADKREAQRECRELRNAAETPANFKSVVQREARKRTQRAFVTCVQTRAKKAESERKGSAREAAEKCRESHEGFRNRGQCVAATRRQNDERKDEEQKERSTNPARACRDEQEANETKFDQDYRNFGACVSKKAQARNDEQQQS